LVSYQVAEGKWFDNKSSEADDNVVRGFYGMIDAFIEVLPKIVSKVTDRRIRKKLRGLKGEMAGKTEEIIAGFQELQRIKEKETDPSKMLSKSSKVLDVCDAYSTGCNLTKF